MTSLLGASVQDGKCKQVKCNYVEYVKINNTTSQILSPLGYCFDPFNTQWIFQIFPIQYGNTRSTRKLTTLLVLCFQKNMFLLIQAWRATIMLVYQKKILTQKHASTTIGLNWILETNKYERSKDQFNRYRFI